MKDGQRLYTLVSRNPNSRDAVLGRDHVIDADGYVSHPLIVPAAPTLEATVDTVFGPPAFRFDIAAVAGSAGTPGRLRVIELVPLAELFGPNVDAVANVLDLIAADAVQPHPAAIDAHIAELVFGIRSATASRGGSLADCIARILSADAERAARLNLRGAQRHAALAAVSTGVEHLWRRLPSGPRVDEEWVSALGLLRAAAAHATVNAAGAGPFAPVVELAGMGIAVSVVGDRVVCWCGGKQLLDATQAKGRSLALLGGVDLEGFEYLGVTHVGGGGRDRVPAGLAGNVSRHR